MAAWLSVCRVTQGSEFIDLPVQFYQKIIDALERRETATEKRTDWIVLRLLGDDAPCAIRLSTIDSVAVLTQAGMEARREWAREWDDRKPREEDED